MTETELPETDLFSPILVEEYIRLMTAAHCIQAEDKTSPLQFLIKEEFYVQIQNNPIQAPLIGLTLSYDNKTNILTVSPTEDFCKMYENKIQEEVALNYAKVNTKRYAKFIKLA